MQDAEDFTEACEKVIDGAGKKPYVPPKLVRLSSDDTETNINTGNEIIILIS